MEELFYSFFLALKDMKGEAFQVLSRVANMRRVEGLGLPFLEEALTEALQGMKQKDLDALAVEALRELHPFPPLSLGSMVSLELALRAHLEREGWAYEIRYDPPSYWVSLRRGERLSEGRFPSSLEGLFALWLSSKPSPIPV